MSTATELQQEPNVSASTLSAIYDDLNAPSAAAFRKALARRGVKARARDVEEFVRSRSERQILAPGPKYSGHIVSHGIDHRWAADIISFVSRPAVDSAPRAAKGGEASKTPFAYVLIVQDIFSRQLWARPLQTLSETTDAFSNILTDTGRRPMRLDTDGGSELVNARFKRLMEQQNINHVVKDPADRNAIATIDRAIATIKRAIRRRREQHGGSWLTQLAPAIEGYNMTPHTATDAPPAMMSDDIIFSEQKEAAEKAADNAKLVEARRVRLQRDGGFRVYVGKRGGLKRRADEPNWSKKIHQVASLSRHGYVADEDGKEFLTKLTKPAPLDSSRQMPSPPKPRAPLLDSLRPYATTLRDLLGGGKTRAAARRELERRRPNFASALRATNLTFGAFLEKFPQLIRRQGNLLYPTDQTTLR